MSSLLDFDRRHPGGKAVWEYPIQPADIMKTQVNAEPFSRLTFARSKQDVALRIAAPAVRLIHRGLDLAAWAPGRHPPIERPPIGCPPTAWRTPMATQQSNVPMHRPDESTRARPRGPDARPIGQPVFEHGLPGWRGSTADRPYGRAECDTVSPYASVAAALPDDAQLVRLRAAHDRSPPDAW